MVNALPLYIASEGTYADWLTKTAPVLDALIASQKQCSCCLEWFPRSEFQGSPYYCPHSQGMETEEDSDVCRECHRDLNDTGPVLP
jgi:hypothetical protein